MAFARLSAVLSVGARGDEASDSDDDTIDTDRVYSRRSSIYSRRSSIKLDDDAPASSDNEEAASMVSGVSPQPASLPDAAEPTRAPTAAQHLTRRGPTHFKNAGCASRLNRFNDEH